MNIIYRLINRSKESGKRFYVGSKQECKVVLIDGVNTMVNVKDGKIYLGSSQSIDFKHDLEDGHIFEAEVLQIVPRCDRGNLNDIENEWIVKLDAVNSEEYYNLGYAIKKARSTDVIVNKYGQTVRELARDNSASSKRDNTAKELGFTNYGYLCIHIYDLMRKGVSGSDISSQLGKHRHFSKKFIEPFNMEKALKDILKEHLKHDLRMLVGFGKCSLKKACKILDIEEPAGRILLGDYVESREYSVASAKGKTKEELELDIAKLIHSGKNFTQVADELGIVLESVKRYFFDYFRRRFKVSDLK